MDNVYKTIEDILEWKHKVENRSMVKCECINELPKNATYSQYLEAKEHDRRIIEGYVGEIMDVLQLADNNIYANKMKQLKIKLPF